MPRFHDDPEPIGLYFGTRLRQQVNFATGGYTTVTERRFYLFLPGRRVYGALPDAGIARFDWEAARRTDPKRCATYRIEGERIRLAWGGGAPAQELPFRRRGAALEIGGVRVESMACPDGLRLDATFGTRSFVAIGNGSGVSGGATLRLGRDGRFAEEGLAGYAGSGAATSTQTGGQGTYRIRDGFLELVYADSRMRKVRFAVPAASVRDPRPAFALVETQVWLKR